MADQDRHDTQEPAPTFHGHGSTVVNEWVRPVLESNHEFNEEPVISNALSLSFRMPRPCHFECIVRVISSEARNPGQKTKISQSQPLTSSETRSFEMTKVDLWRLSGVPKAPHARLGGPHSDRNFENPYKGKLQSISVSFRQSL